MPHVRSTPHPHQKVNPRYVIRRQMKVDGEWRLPGDPVPEAAEWKNLYSYLDLGWIEMLDEDEEDEPSMGSTRPKSRVPESDSTTSKKDESRPELRDRSKIKKLVSNEEPTEIVEKIAEGEDA